METWYNIFIFSEQCGVFNKFRTPLTEFLARVATLLHCIKYARMRVLSLYRRYGSLKTRILAYLMQCYCIWKFKQILQNKKAQIELELTAHVMPKLIMVTTLYEWSITGVLRIKDNVIWWVLKILKFLMWFYILLILLPLNLLPIQSHGVMSLRKNWIPSI